MKLHNKPRFWTGIAMMFIPILIGGVVMLFMLDWSWVTAMLVTAVFSVTAVTLWMVLAIIFIWNGSVIPKKDPRTLTMSKKNLKKRRR